MKVGVDTSVIVACVHANHPLHIVMADWMNEAFENYEVIVAHHSLLEAYAVLTRLPSDYRLAPAEAVAVLRETLQDNAAIAPFSETSMWNLVQRIGETPASGGAAYDAFIIEILSSAGVEAIATGNTQQFRRLSRWVHVIDPCERRE